MTLRRGLFVVLAAALITPFFHGMAQASDAGAANQAATWITSRQRSNGSFASGEASQFTARELAAIVSDGVSGTPVKKALDYIASRAPSDTTEGGWTGAVIAGIVSAAKDPRSFGSNKTNYVAKLKSQYDAAKGAYDTKNFFSNLIAANGLNAAKEPLPDLALTYILSDQCSDGGFAALGCSNGSDVDTTSLAINVLVASGHKTDPSIAKAHSYLVNAQRSDGGFAYQTDPSLPTSSDSTALAVTAMTALGENAHNAPWRQGDGDEPIKALLRLQAADGSFRANKSASKGNALSTLYAIPALTKSSYPIPAHPASAKTTPAPTLPAGGSRPESTPARADESGSASASVQAGEATPSPAGASEADGGSATHKKGKSRVKGTPRPSPFVLGFGEVERKPGGLSMAAWIGLAAGCTGAGVGLWLLRARMR